MHRVSCTRYRVSRLRPQDAHLSLPNLISHELMVLASILIPRMDDVLTD